VPVVAVDLPSGWDADSMEEKAEGAFRADAVVTFHGSEAGACVWAFDGGDVWAGGGGGDWDAGGAIESATGLTWGGSSKAIAEAPRAINGNKGRLGHVLLVGGAYGKAGAPSMASVAAMRAGAGLVTAAVPREILPIVAAVAPELMLTPLEQGGVGWAGDGGAGGGRKLEGAAEGDFGGGDWAGAGAGGVDSGVGADVCGARDAADGDRCGCAECAGGEDVAAEEGGCCGEGADDCADAASGGDGAAGGDEVKEVEADRVGLARRFATEHGVTLVLKGWRTLVAHPDGRVAVNTTGNPSMAKGGSGDILTGIVSAMLAQYPENVADAVEAAVFLHGLAGDFACLAQDEHTVLAMDTVGHLWEAFRARVKDEDGFDVDCGDGENGAGDDEEWTREKRLRTRSENGTLALGEMLTELLPAPKLVVLRGDLGMGKTTLVRGMAAALGADSEEVTVLRSRWCMSTRGGRRG
jgi:NAD(P)H-hydrate repair Nnr-like enzyme with NAD(P)H-hydrate dehydratase domain